NFPSLVFFEQLGVDFLFGRFELSADVVLLADEDQLPRCSVIAVLQEIMHAQPKIFQAELAKVLAANGERIEVVFLEVSPEFPAARLVFSPDETGGQKNQRGDDGGDDVDTDLALQSVHHSTYLIGRSRITTRLQLARCI